MLSLAAAYVPLEAFVRRLPDSQTTMVYPSSIPGVGYQLVPNRYGGIHGGLTINSWGFRHKEFPREKPKGTVRVFVLGDSVAYGGSAEHKPFADTLQDLLRTSPLGSDATVEVINTAVPSYSTCQQYQYLVNYIHSFDPDFVIVGYVLNDPEGPRVPFGLDITTGYINPVFRAYHWVKQRSVLTKYLVAKLSPTVVRLRGGNAAFGPAGASALDEISYWETLHDPKAPYWPRCANCIASFAAYQKATGVPIVFTIFPDFREIPSKRLEAVYARVEAEAQSRGLSVLNLYQHFARLKDIAPYRGDGIHPSTAAHGFVAQLLHAYIGARRLPAPRP